MKKSTAALYRFALILTTLSLAACLFDGGGDKPTPKKTGMLAFNASGQKISGPTATSLPPYSLAVAESLLFVTTSDFNTGALLSFTLDSLKRGPDSLQVFQDSRALIQAGEVYVLERFGADNILKYDPAGDTVFYQKHLGDSWNPADLLVLDPNTAFLSLEDHPMLLKINPQTGDVLDSLDISAYAFTPGPGDSGSAGTSPHATHLSRWGDTLFVSLQRRNGDWRFPGGFSVVLMMRMSTFSIVDTLTAPGRNASELFLVGSSLYLACSGSLYSHDDGALYRWDLSTLQMDTVISEIALGGSLAGIACNASGACLAQLYIGWVDAEARADAPVRRFFLTAGAGPLLAGVADASGGVAVDSRTGIIYVGERAP